MITFEEFIKTVKGASALQNSTTARYIYENIIWDDDIRMDMVEFSKIKKPALCGCIRQICETCNKANSDLQLDNVTKQLIGRMISLAMEPFGYLKDSQIKLTQDYSKYPFASASVYSLKGKPTQTIKRIIVDL